MKINELRIGNYIQRNGVIATVELINSELDEVYFIGEDFYYSGFVCNLEPIPLTEEWLLKFGFVSVGSKKWLFINLTESDYAYLYFNPHGKGIAIDERGTECSFPIDIKSVHQLQNLYFALTNKELIFNNEKK